MRNPKMNLELFQTLNPLYLCYLFIKDQQPGRKDQLPVPTLRMKTVSTVMKYSARSQDSGRTVL